ncbi:MAG: hypothetical protein OQK00_09255 [Rhodobacteraceae bacterium]|nr:hypothetical protein [Paracoccaceae bacterium]MCW9044213.1 hypothetical protein [Pseudopelagicola sp.]
MMSLRDYFLAARLFQSRQIDELAHALSEDDDGPDGGGQGLRHRRRARRAHSR